MLSRFTARIPPRALLALGGFILALAMAETILRVLPPLGPEFILSGTTQSIDNRVFQDDVVLRVVLAPNVRTDGFSTNALGIRGPRLEAKATGVSRVLAVGDSFTLGMQVSDSETFVARLNQELEPAIEVYNAGVPGFGTLQATEQMKRLVPRVQADAALLAVYTGNDFRDNQKWAKNPGLPTTPPPVQTPPPQPPRWMTGLARYSHLVANLMMFQTLKNRESDFRLEEFRDELLPFADRDHLNQLAPPTRTAMQRFAEACQTLQIRCGVALIPPAFVVHPERVERTFNAFGLDPADAQLYEPQSLMKRLVPKSVNVVDLTTALQEGASSRPYLVFDPHFSSNGHQLAAHALAPFIRDLVTTP